MISGDSMRTLEAIADRIGVEQVRSEIPLTGWGAELERIRDTGHKLAIVGRHPYKDKTSLIEDLVIEVRSEEEGGEGPGFETGVVCRDENLELVVDAVEIARKSRRVILMATSAALLVQIFAAGISLSGLVTPLGMGGFINIAAGALWLFHPRQAEKEI
jgi:cation transport ATPase